MTAMALYSGAFGCVLAAVGFWRIYVKGQR
jgi:hypothetical protein